MFWRFVHHASKWIALVILVGVVPLVGLAVGASQVWDDAKRWTEHAFSVALAIGTNPLSWIVALVALLLWLGAFLRLDRKREPASESPQRLSDRLRAIRGTDPVAHDAHIEFVDNAQRAKAARLNDAIRLAGWNTNLGSMPQSHLQKAIEGIEVSGANMGLVRRVAAAIDSNGFGPTTGTAKHIDITNDNPKWSGAQRTVYLMLG